MRVELNRSNFSMCGEGTSVFSENKYKLNFVFNPLYTGNP